MLRAMDRDLFGEEHVLFRSAFRKFVAQEVKPNQARWSDDGMVSREAWRKAGASGFLCPWLDPEHGGPGADLLCSTIIIEELAYAYESGFALSLHSDIVVPYLHEFGTAEQKKRWLPGCASGDLVTAIAMTEPGTGSDLASIATTAIEDGDHYVLNGAKTFISNGILADLVVVAAKTDPKSQDPHRAITLFVVEARRPASSADASSPRWAWPRRTPRSSRSRTAGCPPRIGSARRARGSSC
jgi:acyl-CoA dehydrogenase